MANTGYQLEGHAARLYEQGIVPTMSKPLTEMMFEHISLQDGDRVLDIACGTGILARVVAERFRNIASIVGVDLNPGMLEVAREHTPTTSISIEWRQGDACTRPLPDHRFDVVFCQHGLQFIPNQVAALREMKRVLVPGGRLALTVWGEPTPYQAALAESLRQHVSEAAATSCLAPFALRDVGIIRNLLDEAGFRTTEMQKLVLMRRLPASALDFASQQPYARDVETASKDARAAIENEVKAAEQSYRDDDGGDGFMVPQESHLVLAQTG
jgi:ubiquinone/menaquinone biosynthesis C-methylase UbiE